jgi:cold shock CspA family protein
VSAEQKSGQLRRGPRKRAQRVTPPAERRGVPASGRIVALTIGQGTGFIQTGEYGRVFFHRSDLEEGTSINDFETGAVVDFDLVEDPVSGARAVRVRARAAIPAESGKPTA